MIIVEGPDGAGKTTLVETICEYFDLKVGERGTTDRDLLYTVTKPDTLRALGGMVSGLEPPKVWDRLFFSDFVYAPLSLPARPVAFDADVTDHVMGMLHFITPPMIVCLPPLEVVLANVASERHQMPGVRERIEAIYKAYEDMTNFGGLLYQGVMVFDYTATNPDYAGTVQQVLDYIQSYIDRRNKRT